MYRVVFRGTENFMFTALSLTNSSIYKDICADIDLFSFFIVPPPQQSVSQKDKFVANDPPLYTSDAIYP